MRANLIDGNRLIKISDADGQIVLE